jgi:hypothetical protein
MTALTVHHLATKPATHSKYTWQRTDVSAGKFLAEGAGLLPLEAIQAPTIY